MANRRQCLVGTSIDAEVTKADELLKTAGERKTLLVEQTLAAVA